MIVEVKSLSKVYRRAVRESGLAAGVRFLFSRDHMQFTAVDNLNFSIGAGEAVAYVGPNGAGKSTTVKLLAGILVPSSGQVTIGGIIAHRQRIANSRQIGVLFGQRSQLWWDLPVRESLALLRDLHGLSRQVYERQLERFDSVLGLGDLLSVTARKLSLGQRMRADLAATLLHSPRVVFLDEPTIGLDIDVKDRVRTFLRELRDEGTTIVLTTHDLGDIEDLCHRIMLIDQGRIIFDGGLEQVKDAFAAERRFSLELARPIGNFTALTESVAIVLPGAVLRGCTGSRELSIGFDRKRHTSPQILSAIEALVEVRDFRLIEPSIEDVVRRFYADKQAVVSQPS